MQLVDELSMINTTLMMYFATFAYGKSKRYSVLIAAFLIGIAITITYVYHYLQEPKFHQNAYAVLTSIVLGRSVYLMETRLRTTDEKAVKQLWQLVGWGFFNFGVGFVLWTGDRFFCDHLIAARRAIGLPWGFLLGMFFQKIVSRADAANANYRRTCLVGECITILLILDCETEL
jgi:dihydroceramidase